MPRVSDSVDDAGGVRVRGMYRALLEKERRWTPGTECIRGCWRYQVLRSRLCIGGRVF